MSTYTSLHYHIVFSTKHRIPHIHPSWRPELHKYMAGTVKGLGGYPAEIGGVDDHVHLLLSLKATHRISDFLRDLKSSCSVWVHEKMGVPEFAWQDGYAAFSVSPTSRPGVKGYILRQEEHHGKQTFIEELVELLEQAEIKYDPKYLD